MKHHWHLIHLSVVGGLLLLLLPCAAGADETVQWQQIIGIIQAGNTVGSGTGKVTGGGQPWHTTGGRAEVNLATGELQFSVQGLVLAGGNAIGTPATVTQVKGTLVCDTTGTGNGNSTLVDTDLVALSAQGDADFSGNVGDIPAACANAPNLAFLIRTASGAWIASGEVQISAIADAVDGEKGCNGMSQCMDMDCGPKGMETTCNCVQRNTICRCGQKGGTLFIACNQNVDP